jgi:hypothetical protein
MKISDKLKERLNKELDLDIEDHHKMLSRHAGKLSGSFSWFILGTNIGSYYTMQELLNAEKLCTFINDNSHIEIMIDK